MSIPIFEDFLDFEPNLTPKQIFMMGSFGSTYFRPIYSTLNEKEYTERYKLYECLDDVPEDKMNKSCEEYDKQSNKYKVKVGVDMKNNCGLEYWENKSEKGAAESWIISEAPYGWVEWYIRAYEGKGSKKYNTFQIKRWLGVAGPRGRFRLRLIKMIMEKNGDYNDFTVSPAIRQTLQQWAYKLTKKDYDDGVEYIRKRDKLR